MLCVRSLLALIWKHAIALCGDFALAELVFPRTAVRAFTCVNAGFIAHIIIGALALQLAHSNEPFVSDTAVAFASTKQVFLLVEAACQALVLEIKGRL